MKSKREELRNEIDEVKQRRNQRERERELAEQQRAEIQRQEEARNAVEFEKRGEAFDVLQIKLRRDMRLKDGRGTAIDYLSKNIDLLCPEEEDNFTGYQMEMREPAKLVDGKSFRELEDLQDDIKKFIIFEKAAKSQEYWRAMLVVTEDALDKLKFGGQEASSSGVHATVMAEVVEKLKNKSHQELVVMEEAMAGKVKTGGSGVDVEYWSTILQRLRVLKASAKLREIHQEITDVFVSKLERIREIERCPSECPSERLLCYCSMPAQTSSFAFQCCCSVMPQCLIFNAADDLP